MHAWWCNGVLRVSSRRAFGLPLGAALRLAPPLLGHRRRLPLLRGVGLLAAREAGRGPRLGVRRALGRAGGVVGRPLGGVRFLAFAQLGLGDLAAPFLARGHPPE